MVVLGAPRTRLCLGCCFSRISGLPVGLTKPPSALQASVFGVLAGRGQHAVWQQAMGRREPRVFLPLSVPMAQGGKAYEVVGPGDVGSSTEGLTLRRQESNLREML